MAPTKKPIGQFVAYEPATDAHTVARAMPTERTIAAAGPRTNDRAAAGGPTIRLNISSAPTTGTAVVVTIATTTRNSSSIRRLRTPWASPTSGTTELSSSGR